MTPADPAPPPRWLPPALLAVLVVPFDPGWLDFEQTRRALLLVAVGAMALVRPGWFGRAADGERWLRWLLGWLLLVALLRARTEELVVGDAVLRLGQLTSLWLLSRLGQRSGSAPWLRPAAVVLLATAAAGLLQRFGVPLPGGTAAEPASLFGNRNVAAEVTAVASAAAILLWRRDRHPIALMALALGTAYAVVNASRSALVVLPLLAVADTLLRRGGALRARLLPLGLVALGFAAGGAVAALVPADAEVAAATPDAGRRATTLEVRYEIAAGALQLVEEAPLIGHGPGQFAVQYPRVRSAREIELSSLGRTQQRRVGSAHDDWLECAVEGGLPALLLLLAYAAARWRDARGDRARLLPLLALGTLMLVRSPLQNAPAAALALLTAAPALASVAAAGRAGSGRPALLRLLGLLLLVPGAMAFAGATGVARYLGDRGDAPLGRTPWLERATAAWPFDPVPWQLLAQERQARAASLADAEAALAAADHAVALRPNEPTVLLLRADLLRLCGRNDDAKRDLVRVAKLDPGEPQVQVQLAGVYWTEHNLDGAIAALSADPPPVLRRELATRFDEFAALARQAGDPAAGARFAAEAAFVRALDATGSGDTRDQVLAKERFETMRLAFRAAGLHDTDLREFVVLALQAVDLGDRGTAEQAARAARQGNRSLPAWQWPLLRPAAARLRGIAGWDELLPVP